MKQGINCDEAYPPSGEMGHNYDIINNDSRAQLAHQKT